jgi:PAS domain S-box-containing protein
LDSSKFDHLFTSLTLPILYSSVQKIGKRGFDCDLNGYAHVFNMMEQTEANLRYDLEERLQFETLLAEISARYINLPVEQIDAGIEDDQRRICEYLGLDLSALWQWQDGLPRFLTVTHLYSLPEGPLRPEGIDAEKTFPWVLKKMLSGETLAYSTEDMGPEAAIDQTSRRHFGVKSSVNLPLSVGGGPLIGVLTFDTLREERNWPDELVKRLQLIAQIFANALIRKESEKILSESEARLSLAADSSGAGLWELDCSTNQFWATKRALAIFGYGSEETISMERFEQSVCPEDLTRVQQAITRSLASKEPLNVEYRILAGDGRLKWIHSRGRPYFKPNGEPGRLLGLSLDITERKVSESEHARDQERLASAIDIAGLGFYEMEENNQISFLDDRMCEFLGVPPEEKTNARQFWLEHIHPDDLPRILEVSRKVLEEGAIRFEVEYRYMRPDNRFFWFNHLSRVLQRNTAGRATQVIGTLQDITERKKMEENLQKNEKILRNNQVDLQRLAGRLISVKEEELRRLSRELHDDLTQRLAVLAIEAGKMELDMDEDVQSNPVFLQKISHIKEQLIKISEDVHRISRQLHPTIIDDLGLVRAIESECAALSQRESVEIIFTDEDIPEILPDDVPLCLYRITQESLNNCISHSGTAKCEVFLKGSHDAILLDIEDKGVGFNTDEVRNKPGLGLLSMRERVQLVGGNIKVDTEPGRGTSIHVSIPLEKTNT